MPRRASPAPGPSARRAAIHEEAGAPGSAAYFLSTVLLCLVLLRKTRQAYFLSPYNSFLLLRKLGHPRQSGDAGVAAAFCRSSTRTGSSEQGASAAFRPIYHANPRVRHTTTRPRAIRRNGCAGTVCRVLVGVDSQRHPARTKCSIGRYVPLDMAVSTPKEAGSVEGRTSRPAPLGGRREECWRSVEFGMS